MRISTNTIYDAGLSRMTDSQAKLMKVQQQVAAGKRILSPSDDPVGAARVLNLTQSQEINAQYAANRQNVKNSLSHEESVLQTTTSLIQDVKTLIIQAGNPTYDSTQLKFIAVDLQTRFDELVGIANTRDGMGNYLFAGHQVTTRPYTLTQEGAQFNGDQGRTIMQVDSARQMAISDSGDQIFDNIPSTGTFVSGVAAGNDGDGTVSRLSVVDASRLTGHPYDIVFNDFATVPPMASTAAAGNTGTAAVSPLSVVDSTLLTGNKYDVVFSVVDGVTTYSVQNSSTVPVTIAVPSTVYNAPQNITFDGLQVTVAGSPANGDSMQIRPAPTGSTGTYSVYELNPTRSAVPVATNAYGPGPQTITFQGLQLSVAGTPADGDEMIVRPNEKQSLFTTLKDLITLLETQGSGAAGKANLKHGLDIANNNFGSALDSILSTRASIGSRLKELDNLDQAGDIKNEHYAAAISDIEDLDYNKALSDLTKNQIILEAAQKSFMKVSGLSLFNLL
jgi:flagellar hook-associated protein 3 FlgL